jgi:hypothetical protein
MPGFGAFGYGLFLPAGVAPAGAPPTVRYPYEVAFPFFLLPAAVWAGAATLLAAIVARAHATEALMSLLPGGFSEGYATDEAIRNRPYGVLHEVAESPGYAVQGRRTEGTDLQASFFGDDPDVLKAIKVAWEDAFHPGMTPLLVAGRYQTFARSTAAHLVADPEVGPDAGRVFQQVVEFRVGLGLP